MSDFPMVQFVDAPTLAATVRYDFNDDTADASRRVANEDGDFTLGIPTLEGDPDAVGQTFGFRAPSFKQRVKGNKDAALAALAALSKELLRPTNWLMVQLDAFSAPVWLRIYRSGFAPLSLNRVVVRSWMGDPTAPTIDAWEIAVPLLADAFGYGARVAQASATLGSSLSATNPLRLVLPALKGDAPTNLRVTLTPATGTFTGARMALVAADTTISDPVADIGTGDGFTAGTGTGAGTTNSAYLGGKYRAVTIGSVTPPASNLLRRLQGTLPSTPAVGRYKVYLKCQADAASGTVPNHYLFRFSQNTAGVGDPIEGTSVVVDTPHPNGLGVAGPFDGWVDLGDFTFPPGVANLPADVTPTAPAATFGIDIGTSTGAAGAVRIDALKLVPVSGPLIRSATTLRTMIVPAADATLLTTSQVGNWDGDTEAFWSTASGVLTPGDFTVNLAGAFLVADPAATQNLLVVLPEGPAADATGVWGVVVSYYPRLLHLGDGT